MENKNSEFVRHGDIQIKEHIINGKKFFILDNGDYGIYFTRFEMGKEILIFLYNDLEYLGYINQKSLNIETLERMKDIVYNLEVQSERIERLKNDD
ncbi:MAG: hypothetical protein MUO82_10720 [Candidatus Thermoplasmatota archaeon]|nr:hypothetical protein [Candidatus Thermoplasmatota archaeon]